jgi:hypothetical protein
MACPRLASTSCERRVDSHSSATVFFCVESPCPLVLSSGTTVLWYYCPLVHPNFCSPVPLSSGTPQLLSTCPLVLHLSSGTPQLLSPCPPVLWYTPTFVHLSSGTPQLLSPLRLVPLRLVPLSSGTPQLLFPCPLVPPVLWYTPPLRLVPPYGWCPPTFVPTQRNITILLTIERECD